MIERILAQRVRDAEPENAVAQENALAEVLQHYVLASLARSGLFSSAAFHGGTFLRIVHLLDRFSEDLDFVLKVPDPLFTWSGPGQRLTRDLAGEGLPISFTTRSSTDTPVRKAMVSFDFSSGLLAEALPFPRHRRRLVRIRLELDTKPPDGSLFETAFLSFPVTTALTVQTLGSAFASKSHALLCREYVKGRDWFDFLWYASRRVEPNWRLLENALVQAGPWAGTDLRVTPGWYLDQLGRVIDEIDWTAARQDVERFLSGRARESLHLWSRELFSFHLKKLDSAFPWPPRLP